MSKPAAADSTAPHDIQKRRRPIEGGQIAWEEMGSGPPLLLLHGYGGTARWWTRNVRQLARRSRVYALDLPGFGRSRLRGPFRFDRAATLLLQWMDAEGIGSANIVAHSMGGQLALLFAARYPAKVRSLVLLAPAGMPFSTGLPGIAWQAMRSRRGGDPRFTPIVVTGSLRAGPRILWQAVRQIREVNVRGELAAITAPTMILWGEGDQLLSPNGGPIIAQGIRGAQLRIVAGAGHNLMYEQAELVNAAIKDFIASQAVVPYS